ncbi:MAG: glycosyltransferase family 2 protein [Bacteriovoracia bacterium]
MKSLIAIPCYNCAIQVERVFKALMQLEFKQEIEILFIDNNSTDNTVSSLLELRDQIPSQRKIHIWKNQLNYGLGGSQKIAINHAIKNGFDWLVLLHGDDQASVEDILSLLSKAQHKNHTVLGSRFMLKSKRTGYQFKRVLGNVALNLVFTLLKRKMTLDLGSGLNVFKVDQLKKISISELSNNFNFNVDILLNYYDQNLEFEFYPIIWREADQTSNAKNVAVAYSMLKSLLLNILGKKRKITNNESVFNYSVL